MNELPQIQACNYVSTTNTLDSWGTTNAGQLGRPVHAQPFQIKALLSPNQTVFHNSHGKELQMTTRRIVQVFVVDPNENVPLSDCVLYEGEPKMTDLTDQELFFELDIRDLMTRHNEKRTKMIDKDVKERIEYLEPARIRDLKMTVVNIATF